jgi:hypothetical protein
LPVKPARGKGRGEEEIMQGREADEGKGEEHVGVRREWCKLGQHPERKIEQVLWTAKDCG